MLHCPYFDLCLVPCLHPGLGSQDHRVDSFCGLFTHSNLIVFIYPVYASFKALKTTNKEDDEQWLSYWVIYALFNVIESIPLVTKFIPYFSLIRVIALVLCYLPQTQVDLSKNTSFIGL